MQTTVIRAPSIEEISKSAAQHICDAARRCVKQHGSFTLVLAGGNTPQRLYELLATPPFSTDMPWHYTHLFWGDERWVPHDHPDSNFNMASKSLIKKIQIPAANIHPISTDLDLPKTGATVYETLLQDIFNKGGKLDLILLGMGNDGHTASLFPDSESLNAADQFVVSTSAPDSNPKVVRITLTLHALNMAQEVLFLIAGPPKNKVLETILHDPLHAQKLYPAARVKPKKELFWFAALK